MVIGNDPFYLTCRFHGKDKVTARDACHSKLAALVRHVGGTAVDHDAAVGIELQYGEFLVTSVDKCVFSSLAGGTAANLLAGALFQGHQRHTPVNNGIGVTLKIPDLRQGELGGEQNVCKSKG